MIETWITIGITAASTIISTAIGAFITYLFNSHTEKQKFAYQRELEKEKERKEEYQSRPRLEIKSYDRFDYVDHKRKFDSECVILTFEQSFDEKNNPIFTYDEAANDVNSFCCVEYTFINTGKTEIDSIHLVSNLQKTTSIIEFENRDFLLGTKFISYNVTPRKTYIKPGQEFTLRVCYLRNKIAIPFLSSMIDIYLEDINENLWVQPLYCPKNQIDNSRRATVEDFKQKKDENLAIECFKNPYLW